MHFGARGVYVCVCVRVCVRACKFSKATSGEDLRLAAAWTALGKQFCNNPKACKKLPLRGRMLR